jgi:hypothetical protein
MVEDLALFLCLNFGHAYGLVENRLFREAGEYFPGHHFRLYHGWLAMLDLANALVVLALSGSWMLTAFAAVYFPLGLDFAWWVKRWLEFRFYLYILNVPIFLGPVASPGYYGESNAWHDRIDWDNYLGPPLVFGCYAWWWIFGVASACLLGLSLL